MSAESLTSISGDTKQLLTDSCSQDRNAALSSKRALWKIVRHAGSPGAEDEKSLIVNELIAALSSDLPPVGCREAVWMLSEIGGDESVEPIASLLSHRELQEDARMALERIPGDTSLAALRSAMDTVADDFKINLAQSLRRRGVKVDGFPCQKLVPTKETRVEATS